MGGGCAWAASRVRSCAAAGRAIVRHKNMNHLVIAVSLRQSSVPRVLARPSIPRLVERRRLPQQIELPSTRLSEMRIEKRVGGIPVEGGSRLPNGFVNGREISLNHHHGSR